MYYTPKEIIPNLRRVKLIIQYDGTPYHGWQSQKEPVVPTIEDAFKKAFYTLTNTPLQSIVAAGRTDKGVHATEMTCHVDTFHHIETERLKTGLNRYLPSSIAVLKAQEVDQHFHARYLCCGRSYVYTIINRYNRRPLYENRAALVRQPLNIEHMQEAAKTLIGTHDFSAFRSSECQAKTPTTTLNTVSITPWEYGIKIDLEGITFLHNMVRILTGTLVDIGVGRKKIEDMSNILASKDRTKAGKTMPACGLYFKKAFYNQ